MAIEPARIERSSEHPEPANVEAEEAVLGSLLMDSEAIYLVAPYLQPEDFFRERNGIVYAAITSLYNRRETVDILTVADELKRAGHYDSMGGFLFLTSLLEVVPTSINAERYARIVQRHALMRRLIQAGGKIAAIGYDLTLETETALERAEQVLNKVALRQADRDFQSLNTILREYLEQIRLVPEGGAAEKAVRLGYLDLDKMTGGLQPSDLIILAARPSMGKTSLALNIARHAAIELGKTVAIFSLEMSRTQLAQRLLAMESGVDSSRMRQGSLSQKETRRLSQALGVLSEAPVFVDDTPSIPIGTLRAKSRRLHAEKGVHLIIVDYLQLVSGSVPENRVQEITEISQSLKVIARELEVPVLALSQLSRAVESRSPHIPMLSDLRESGSLEQDADLVMFIYREEVYNHNTDRKGIADIYLAKHRNGPTGRVSLLFQERTTRFQNLETYQGAV